MTFRRRIVVLSAGAVAAAIALAAVVTYVVVRQNLRDGVDASLQLRHAGEQLTVAVGEPVVRKLTPREPLLPSPQQPPGRAPLHRAAAPGATPGT